MKTKIVKNVNTIKEAKPTFLLTKKLHSPTDPDYLYLIFIRTSGVTAAFQERSFTLEAGDILLFSGGIPLRLPETEKASSQSLVLAFQTARADEHIGPLLFGQNPISRFLHQNLYVYHYEDYLTVSTGRDTFPEQLLTAMYREQAEHRPYQEYMLYHYFCLLMTHLIREHSGHCHRDVKAPISEEGFRIMADIISSDFRLTLADIAAAHHIAPSYASRYIRKTTGVSFSTLLYSARDHVACLMLATTSKSIRSIAEQVGYDTPENFVRAFKKKHGCTPSEYRRAQNGNSLKEKL